MTAQEMLKSLPSEFAALYGEVVTLDIYKIRNLSFVPDVVVDVGANVGFFTGFARELFPDALIVGLEPHPANFQYLERWCAGANTILINKGLGCGRLYRATTAANGSGESYFSSGLGYPYEMVSAAVRKRLNVEDTKVQSITLEQLFLDHCPEGAKVLLKVDCEGAENSIWEDPFSFDALASSTYIAMELHDYGMTQYEASEVMRITNQALVKLHRTHHVERNGVYLWALKHRIT